MAQLTLKGLTKRFGEVTAVEGLTLELLPGELLTLVGPSGCGKTTTLRLIAGFEAPDAGEIELDGRRITNLPPEERGIGIVFQNYALFPHMDAFQNIAYGLKASKSEKRRRVEELLGLMGLKGLERRRPSELSAGQQQRVALARALAPEPKVLLLDEPLSALDVQLRVRLRMELKRLQRRLGITTLYVTHDQEEALAISDRVAVMSEGRLEQLGPPWEVYHRPTSPFVAGFIGHGNLLKGQVAAVKGDRVRLQLGDGVSVMLTHSRRLNQGDVVQFLIRPERLRLDGRGENRFHGVVRGVEFLGDAAMLHVEGAGCQWRVKVTELDQNLIEAEGNEVTLSFSPADGLIYPPQE
jgi:ABC-type Fe3+/spermidine/putrescine transport system ATPase subunit